MTIYHAPFIHCPTTSGFSISMKGKKKKKKSCPELPQAPVFWMK